MEISVKSGNVLHQASDLAVLGCFEDVPLAEEVLALLEPADFKGRVNDALLLYPRGALAAASAALGGIGQEREKLLPRRSAGSAQSL